MEFCIEIASGSKDRSDVAFIEDEVFRLEMGIRLPEMDTPASGAMLQFIARLGEGGAPIGALTMVETTGDRRLHQKYGIVTAEGARVARYTRLAVLRPFRGQNVPLRLMLEAQRHFVIPNHIQRTWLCFDAGRSFSSPLNRVLGFTPGARVVRSEYGLCRVLQRNEQTWAAEDANRLAWEHLGSFAEPTRAPQALHVA